MVREGPPSQARKSSGKALAAPLPLLSHPRYKAGEVLGQGAQGVVVRVVDQEAKTAALVAKIFRPGTFDSGTLAGEYALLARLRLPGIVSGYDFGWDEVTGAPFLVEEWVEGVDAAEWVFEADVSQRNGRLLVILSGVAAALSGLHAAGFTHGDLKPAHVRMRKKKGPGELTENLRNERMEALLLDLGAAIPHAQPRSAQTAFTPAFAAPEILAGEPSSPKADLYGLGALVWAVATGKTKPRRLELRALAPWVEPRIAALVDRLCADRKEERPASASEVVSELGMAAASAGLRLGAPPVPIGREAELAVLSTPMPGGVRFVTGPSGVGKSHLVRELSTGARLLGRLVRHVRFPAESTESTPALLLFLRGAGPWPFVETAREESPLLLVLDDLESAPAEVVASVDAYRCRSNRSRLLDVVVTQRSAPDGAEVIALGPLGDGAFRALCTFLGVSGEGGVQRAKEASGGNPGWLVAWVGRIPLSKDTVLSRARDLPKGAQKALAAVSVAGGDLGLRVLGRLLGTGTNEAVSALLSGALVDRWVFGARVRIQLSSKVVAGDVAAALSDNALVDELGAAVLSMEGEEGEGTRVLLTLATAGAGVNCREGLLARAALSAKAAGHLRDEIEALAGLLGEAKGRTGERLLRLEKLLRDAGMGPGYPQILDWLTEAGEKDERVRLLALRRQAEKAGREGDASLAERLATQAVELADKGEDLNAQAFARATAGLVALLKADWNSAEQWLEEAGRMVGDKPTADAEERARLDHNTGVVAIYKHRLDVAITTFERALRTKRALGDRAGMRSCLMNLGIALGKAERDAEARDALEEAIRLARSLGQTAGLGWCLSAFVDLELRKRDARAAERWLSEANGLSSALPAAIQADLAIQRARVALLDGDGEAARQALEKIDAEVQKNDPLVDSRALVTLSAAHLAMLPPSRRAAARAAVAAVRKARAGSLPEVEREALSALRAAREAQIQVGKVTPKVELSSVANVETPAAPAAEDGDTNDGALWSWVTTLPTIPNVETAAIQLCATLVRIAGAERAFLVELDGRGHVAAAWGSDLDGLAIAEATQRIPEDVLDRALRQKGPQYQRKIPFLSGIGSRLSVRHETHKGSSLVVVEHRFREGAFDQISATWAQRWAALGAIVLRTWGSEGGKAQRSVEDKSYSNTTEGGWEGSLTTVLPLPSARRSFSTIVGESPAIRRARAHLDAAANTDLPVLLVGETGTGKEVFARALHDHSHRATREFVAMNCGSVPETLFEAELFGHARGAFTGAERARAGLFARAEGGTLLLDEVGEMPLGKQAVLLRALESKRFRAVGSDEERPLDVRVVSATNRDLGRAAEGGMFRSDLLYRLNAITIEIPPLRRRGGDIPLLLQAFLRERGRDDLEIAEEAMDALVSYPWPGNVRELRNLVDRLASLGIDRVSVSHLPRGLRGSSLRRVRAVAPRPESSGSGEVSEVVEPLHAPHFLTESTPNRERIRPILRPSLDEERKEAQSALTAEGGNISRAALRLGLTRHGLKKRLRRLGLREPDEGRKVS